MALHTFYSDTTADAQQVNENFSGLADGTEIGNGVIVPRHLDYPTTVEDSDNTSTSAITGGTATTLAVALTAGTWLVTYHITVRVTHNTSNNGRSTCHLGNNPGTETHPQFTTRHSIGLTTGGATNAHNATHSITQLLTVTSADTYSIWFDNISASAVYDCVNAPAYLTAIKITEETS